MLIAVVSDTHQHRGTLDEIIKCTEKAEVLIHLGDNVEDALYLKRNFKGEVYYVKGNCDPYNSAPAESIIELQGIKIFAAHGDRYGVKMGTIMLKMQALEAGAQVALYGHTHIASMEEEEGIWIINPGSAALPRMGKKSIAFLDVQKDKKVIPYIYTL
ncbi:metallophosphoesterase [Clostridium polynesiense]|uniref:metallophosphoesterase n=1 Tax=Clostridium polynesiense TaxID=1325933 RepID=UPI00058CCEE8|nr:metallophosphoesterase [Clostridium polynesiense]